MRHTVVEENAEVFPLYSTRILKLIDHDMLEICTDFLVYKWSIAVSCLYHAAQSGLSIGEHKACILLVEVVHFFANPEQQAHLVEVFERRLGRFRFSNACLSLLFCILKVRHKDGFSQFGNASFSPSGGICHAVLCPFRKEFRIFETVIAIL